MNVFSSENANLKTKLNSLNLTTKNKLSENFKQLRKDLSGAHLMGNNLKFEINCLAKQNLFLRNK